MQEKKDCIRIYRGSVYMADLNPIKDNEQGGIRPVLVLQNNVGNKNSSTTLVAPLTSRTKNPLPTHVEIMNPMGEINTILLEHVRAISQTRIIRYMWTMDSTVMKMVNTALAVSLGMIPLPPAPVFQQYSKPAASC